jgi:HAD superfamily hydrolase (TIGR01509 family)
VIRAVFFDGDQTLWDFQALMRRALLATLNELRSLQPGPAAMHLDVDSLIADREAVAADLRGRETNLERLRLAAFRRTVSRLDLPDGGLAGDALAVHLNAFYLKRRFENVELFPDVRPVLETLRATYRLGLLSNGNGYPGRSGLAGVFSAVVFSQDHGIEKPDPRLFAAAAAAIGCAGPDLVMVGDSLVNDVTGARNAGWHGIWLNRDGATCPQQHAPDAQITTLLELPRVLARIQATTPP